MDKGYVPSLPQAQSSSKVHFPIIPKDPNRPAPSHSMIDLICRLLWRLIQLLADTCVVIRVMAFELRAALPWSYDFWHRNGSISHRDRTFLERCRMQLTKLPQHVNIILGTADSSRDDVDVISSILTYALIMGIEYVSFYDPLGGIEVSQLRDPCLTGVTATVLHPSKRRMLWEWDARYTTPCPRADTDSCNSQRPKRVEIFHILPCDNQQIIGEVCGKLFENRQSSEVQELLRDRARLAEHIDKELRSQIGFSHPDPDLSIVFEEHMCTYGMLPWQTRFTEFHKIERGQRINPKTFAKVLYRYSRCEQRWGK